MPAGFDKPKVHDGPHECSDPACNGAWDILNGECVPVRYPDIKRQGRTITDPAIGMMELLGYNTEELEDV